MTNNNGGNPSTHYTLYGYGNVHPLCLMSWVDLSGAADYGPKLKGAS